MIVEWLVDVIGLNPRQQEGRGDKMFHVLRRLFSIDGYRTE